MNSVQPKKPMPGLPSVLIAIQKALLSLTDPAIFIRILIPFLLPAFIGIACLIIFWSDITGSMTAFMKSMEWLVDSLAWLFSVFNSDGTFILTFISGFLFTLFVGVGIYVTAILLTSIILVPLLLPVIRNKYYPEISLLKTSNFFPSLINGLKGTFIFCILFFLCIPLLLIPIVQIIVILLLNSYLAQKVFPFDVLQDLALEEEIKSFRKEYKTRLWMLAISTGVLVYIPIVNFIAPSIMALSFIFYILDNLVPFRENVKKV